MTIITVSRKLSGVCWSILLSSGSSDNLSWRRPRKNRLPRLRRLVKNLSRLATSKLATSHQSFRLLSSARRSLTSLPFCSWLGPLVLVKQVWQRASQLLWEGSSIESRSAVFVMRRKFVVTGEHTLLPCPALLSMGSRKLGLLTL